MIILQHQYVTKYNYLAREHLQRGILLSLQVFLSICKADPVKVPYLHLSRYLLCAYAVCSLLEKDMLRFPKVKLCGGSEDVSSKKLKGKLKMNQDNFNKKFKPSNFYCAMEIMNFCSPYNQSQNSSVGKTCFIS